MHETSHWRDGRVVDYSGLENRRTERYRGFESLSLRKKRNPIRVPFFCSLQGVLTPSGRLSPFAFRHPPTATCLLQSMGCYATNLKSISLRKKGILLGFLFFCSLRGVLTLSGRLSPFTPVRQCPCRAYQKRPAQSKLIMTVSNKTN